MSTDAIFRSVAVVAAAALVAAPGFLAASKAAYKAAARWWSPTSQGREKVTAFDPVTDDACTIISIARRLQKAGSEPGVELCQKLLGVLLQVRKGE